MRPTCWPHPEGRGEEATPRSREGHSGPLNKGSDLGLQPLWHFLGLPLVELTIGFVYASHGVCWHLPPPPPPHPQPLTFLVLWVIKIQPRLTSHSKLPLPIPTTRMDRNGDGGCSDLPSPPSPPPRAPAQGRGEEGAPSLPVASAKEWGGHPFLRVGSAPSLLWTL